MRALPFLLALLAAAPVGAQSDAPTVILHGGDVFTADPGRPRARAVAVRGERIVAVGPDAEVLALAGPNTTVIDLGGRLVVPGINDAHIHVGPWPAMRDLGLSGPADPSWATVLDSVRSAAASTPAGTWISGEVGGAVLEAESATRFVLDSVSPDRPVMLSGFTGHGLVVNTAALRALGLSEVEPDRPGGWYGRVAGTDTLDGRLWEYAHLDVVHRLSSPFSRADAVAAYRRLSDRMLRWGVTSVQQMENDRPIGETLAALAEADLPLRWGVFEWPMPVRHVTEPRPPVVRPAGLPDRVRVLGTKWMLDGTPIERLAALREPYADRPGWSGRLNFSPGELRAILRAALEGEGGTALHAAGDSTLALVLRTMAELAPAEAWRSRRVRIEHGDGTMADLLPQMVDLGVVLVQNPLHLGLPQVLHARYGPERTPHVQLLRSALAAGVPVALGADAGGSGRNPWLNLMLATIHPANPAEALGREDALAAFTRGSAFAEGMEHEKGTLAPGMLADLAVLSQNVLEVPPDDLPATESVLTMVGGAIVYRAAPSPAAAGGDPRPPPILDMHMHARTASFYGTPPLPICAPVERMPRWDQRRPMWQDGSPPPCGSPLMSPATDEELFRETLAAMERHNVIGVLGGAPELVREWTARAPGRFIPALDVRFDAETGEAFAPVPPGAPRVPLPPERIRELHRSGALRVLAEVTSQYAGIAPDDARLEALWALAEELDVPVGIHIGGGEPGTPYTGSPAFRARLQSALTLEEVLVRHPRLRVYVMHAGYPLLEDLQALLFTHPQVYVEPSMAINVETRASFYRFLRALVEAGYGDRVMFGSDQLIWPGLIDAAVRSIEEAPFLTPEQKRGIFYDNAARFLRLTPEEIARHHGR